jgi:hypothetical protein
MVQTPKASLSDYPLSRHDVVITLLIRSRILAASSTASKPPVAVTVTGDVAKALARIQAMTDIGPTGVAPAALVPVTETETVTAEAMSPNPHLKTSIATFPVRVVREGSAGEAPVTVEQEAGVQVREESNAHEEMKPITLLWAADRGRLQKNWTRKWRITGAVTTTRETTQGRMQKMHLPLRLLKKWI